MHIPFSRPQLGKNEFEYIREAMDSGHLHGNGPFTQSCHEWLQERTGCGRAFLTHSCTAALEMCARLAALEPGDEVIMPSFTFVTTASAFVAASAVPVFVDIRPDTLNLDESKIEDALTERTRVIVAVHYGGVACEMDAIRDIADRHGLLVIEDAAQSLLSTYKGRPLGSVGDMAALSFHNSKNITSGEGGALLVNAPELEERADIMWQKGTDRSRFDAGEVDKYTWLDLGSSYQLSDLNAAFLKAQFEIADDITSGRLEIWNKYNEALAPLEKAGTLRRATVPDHCGHNGHLFYILLDSQQRREAFLGRLNERGIGAAFHFVPLHTSPAGRKFGRAAGDLPITDRAANCLARLPLWYGMEAEVDYVISETLAALSGADHL